MSGASSHDRLWRALGTAASAIGLVAAVAPGRIAAVYGLPALDGSAAFAWRLFGVRTLAVGVGVVRGSEDARRMVLPVQAMDQLVFLGAALSGSVPRRTWLGAALTSAGLIAAAGVAGRR